MATDRFRRLNHSNVYTKDYDFSANFPLAPGGIIFSEEIPAGQWKTRGFDAQVNTPNAQIKIKIEAAFEKRPPRVYKPIFRSLLQTPMEFMIIHDGTEPGMVSFSEEFIGDYIRFSIENVGAVDLDDLDFTALLAGDPNLL